MRFFCLNCMKNLTTKNIQLALGDIVTVEFLARATFFCPSYSKEEGCKVYSPEDEEKPAHFLLKPTSPLK